MSAPVTQWFDENPARPGIWEVETSDKIFADRRWFSYWDGANWNFLAETPAGAYVRRRDTTGACVERYRGLADKPATSEKNV